MGVAVDSAGNLYIADTGNSRIRKVSVANGTITTVAGNGTSGFTGDGSSATSAELNRPVGVAVDSAGNLYIADTGNNRIRKVSNGVITTIAGSGAQGYSGDGGPATIAALSVPTGVAVDSAGNVYIADYGNDRVRVLTQSSCTYSVGSTSLVAPASGGYFTISIQTGAYCSWAVSGLPAWMAVSGASSGAGSGLRYPRSLSQLLRRVPERHRFGGGHLSQGHSASRVDRAATAHRGGDERGELRCRGRFPGRDGYPLWRSHRTGHPGIRRHGPGHRQAGDHHRRRAGAVQWRRRAHDLRRQHAGIGSGAV